ncbi:beta-ketoacyl-ACP synthase II [Ktedonobacter racemifer]|uniref:3-oxoacyl-[acyl-carrier-protein] synthase 2 n=1 Tax=Ktedonobacter racemifer DSM 44963 TaxID=485913 RepID=D6TDA7_KTERA|nr:beta-ketoacyl-ACP synthase II [Ktedonobacter racemifer]EFH88252.1 3-oxoacyl-(acyl-carrier-protein) synthase 2 [Ktedonobacter racemifer DSM 44963]
MKRVVITGMGLVTALGHTVEETWEALCQGRSGIGPIRNFDASEYPVRFAGEVRNFDPSRYLEHKEIRRNDPFTHLAAAASRQALAQARLSITEQLAPHIGVCIGSGVGGLLTLHEQFVILHEKGPARVSPFLVPMMMINAAPGMVSLLTGAQGPAWAAVSACATGGNALGEAWETIRRGAAKAMLAGGAEKAVTKLSMAAFANMHALSRRNEDPQGASRPFDAERDGFVMGEGAGMLLLEDLDFALERGAPILAELVGYGSTADAYHITEPAPGGEGLVRAMERALQSAGLRPEQVDYINAHGTATRLNDATETQAIKTCFGDHAYQLAISSTKSMLGHTFGAAGAIEAAISILSIVHGIIPPTINLEHPDPACDLDYVPNQARKASVHVALSNSMGFGGHNTCLLFKWYEP